MQASSAPRNLIRRCILTALLVGLSGLVGCAVGAHGSFNRTTFYDETAYENYRELGPVRTESSQAWFLWFWPIGKPGLYGGDDGVPTDIGFLTFMPDGALWAIGSEVARFDGETWTGVEGGHRAVTPDGTLWLLSPNGGLESWDGQTFTPRISRSYS